MSYPPLRVEILGHPPSVNRIYRIHKRGIFKIKAAASWGNLAEGRVRLEALKVFGKVDLSYLKGHGIILHLQYTRETWHGKTKSKKHLYVRPDLSNFIKVTEDAVCKALGLDDCAVKYLLCEKVEAPGPDQTIIQLRFE